MVPSLRLRSSASQDELGVVVDVGDGNTQHGVRPDGNDQAADREAKAEMSGMRWRVDLPWIRTECSAKVNGVRHQLNQWS